MKGKYLITTDDWFYAPDGRTYKSVFGEVEVLNDNNTLGIKTNARATNWYAKVGTEENHVLIAGCQIHYAVKTDCVKLSDVDDYSVDNGVCKKYSRPSNIYIAL